MTVVTLITFITALALQRFKHLKKDVIASPGVLAFLFAAIKGYALKNKGAEIIDYLAPLLDDTDQGEIYSETGNTTIDSIINYKLRNAKQKNIQLDINLNVPPVLNIETSDIAVILGNLLDNALHAVTNVPEKKINLDIESSKGTLLIVIKNTYDGIVRHAAGDKNVSAGFAADFVSRKTGKEHGYGLKNIRRAVDKYDGLLEITHDTGTFSAVASLYEPQKADHKSHAPNCSVH